MIRLLRADGMPQTFSTVSVKGCRCNYVGTTTDVPRIADGLLPAKVGRAGPEANINHHLFGAVVMTLIEVIQLWGAR